MRRLAAVLAAGLALSGAGAAMAAPVAPLRHEGRWIVDAKGRVVILHGINMVNKLPPYHPAALGFGNDDVAFLRREGFNTVRVGIIYKGLESVRGQYDDAYLGRIESTLRKLERAGVFPLVDFHQDMYNERFNGEGWPDWAVQDDGLPAQPDQGFPQNYFVMPALWRAYDHFWANDPAADGTGLQDAYAAAWRHVAERFRGRRGLVGYDIVNEPFPGSTWQSCANPDGCPAFEGGPLTDFSKRVFAAIREVERRKLLWWEPSVTFTFGAASQHGDTGDPRAGMSFHDYCIAAPGGSENAGGGEECRPLEARTFDNAVAKAQETGDALLLSEFGATDNLDAVERVLEGAEERMIPWQYWSYWNEDVCCERPNEGLVQDLSQPPAGANIKREKLAVLARAYPRVVAGTPESYDFDRETRVFDLRYRVRRPHGGAVRPGTETEVFLPRRHYKGRYDVAVTGGRVVSKRGKTVLRIVALPGAEHVTVHVTPR